MHVVTIEVPHLRNRTHLVHDGRVGVVIDPPRQVGAVEAAAEEAGVDIVAVAETHIHDDYVSGGLFLSKRHRASYLVAADEDVDFDRIEVHDNETLSFGDIDLRAIATPGHTPLHLAFLASDATTGDDRPSALFSGGSLLHGTVGRTDLVDPFLTTALTRAQWLSARRLGALPAETSLHPTHGSGGLGGGTSTPAVDGIVTVGDQRATNPALTLGHEPFVSTLLGTLDPAPSHHTRVSARNRAGAWDPRPHHPIDLDGVRHALARGAHVVDVRSAADYAAGHIPGTLSVPAGPQCALYIGWVTPWGAELVLVSDADEGLEQLVAELGSIGIERVRTAVVDTSEAGSGATGWTWLRRTDWAGYVEDPPAAGSVVIDVRRPDEWCAGHLPGARNIPVHELLQRLEEIPRGEVWVHCDAGYRAAVAAGILDRAGRDVVLVDDEFPRVTEIGLHLQSGRPAA